MKWFVILVKNQSKEVVNAHCLECAASLVFKTNFKYFFTGGCENAIAGVGTGEVKTPQKVRSLIPGPKMKQRKQKK